MKKILLSLLLLVTVIMLYINMKEQKVPILTYHNVVTEITEKNTVNISQKKFEKQMKYLYKHHYKTISMTEFYNWKKNNKKIPKKSILITFDDGSRSVYENALPILKKYNLKATIFVIGFAPELKEYSDRYMTLTEIRNLKKDYPNIEIASHSYSLHEEIIAKSVDYKIVDNDLKTFAKTYPNTHFFAYPFGIRNKDYIKALKDNNYKLSFTFGPYDFAKKSDDDYQIPRLGIDEQTNDLKLKLKLFLN